MTLTLRVRSIVWFCTGAGVAVVVMLVALSAMRAEAAPGDDEATLVPITPCRLVDTRPPPDRVGPQGTFGAAETRTIIAHGTNGQCTIPSDAVGLSLNVTAVDASLPTFLTIWPEGDLPLASSLNPTPGQPPTPNAVSTRLGADGAFRIYNLQGSVEVIVDVNGYLTNDGLASLHERIAQLEAKTASMSATTEGGRPTVRFSGVNLQVVDSSGDSQCSTTGFEPCNGTGNLIVGYQEDFGAAKARSGSHNLVVGANHEWTSHSGLAAGFSNTISGASASALGQTNTASGDGSSVSGGSGNIAGGVGSSVSGGQANLASGLHSSVSGGSGNTADGGWSSASGGSLNAASGNYSAVSGGSGNTASGTRSSVSAGFSNIASGERSSVAGGESNLASGSSAAVTGGRTNWATGQQSSVSGGRDNIAGGSRTEIVGGAGCTDNTSNGVLVGAVTGTTCTQLN